MAKFILALTWLCLLKVHSHVWEFLATVIFSNILLETFVPYLVIPNLSQSPDIGQNSGGSISDLQIYGQSLQTKIDITAEQVVTLT